MSRGALYLQHMRATLTIPAYRYCTTKQPIAGTLPIVEEHAHGNRKETLLSSHAGVELRMGDREYNFHVRHLATSYQATHSLTLQLYR